MSVHRIIWVSPIAEGWAVRCAELETLVFRSGRRAEEQAKRLAACLAGLGRGAQVHIQDRRMNLIGTLRFPPA